MNVRHTLRLRAVLHHAATQPPGAGPLGTSGLHLQPGLSAPVHGLRPHHRRHLSLWPTSNAKASAAAAAAPEVPAAPESSVLPEPNHGGDVTAAAAPFDDPLPTSAVDVPSIAPTVDDWTMAKTILAEHDLGHGLLVGKLQFLLEYVHLHTGWAWYATIVAVAAFTRLSLFPLLGRSIANSRRLAIIQPQLQPLLVEQTAARARGDREGVVRAIEKLRTLWRENHCHPARILLMPIVSMPIGIGTFFGLRGMAEKGVPGLSDGGIGWVTDLTVPDPYYILPVTSAICQIAAIRLGIETGQDPSTQTPQQATMKSFLQYLMVASIAVTSFMPSAMLVYWNSSNLTGLVVSQAFRLGAVKRYFGIPPPIAPLAPASPVPHAPSFYDSVLKSMPAAPTTPTDSAAAPLAPSQPPGQDPTLLRESLFSGDVKFDAGRPLPKRHRGRIEDFGHEFATHHQQSGGEPWPLPPGLTNKDVHVQRGDAIEVPPSSPAPAPAPAPERRRSSSTPYLPAQRSPPGRRNFSLQSRTPKIRTSQVQPQFFDSAKTVDEAKRAALAGLSRGAAEAADRFIEAHESAHTRRLLRVSLFDEALKLVASLTSTTNVNDVDAQVRSLFVDRRAPPELIDDLAPRVRRRYLDRVARDGATTTLEFSSAQMAGSSVAGVGATQAEVKQAIDMAASLAATQKADAYRRGCLRRQIYAGAVDWSPRPLHLDQLERRARLKMRGIWTRRFQRERLGRWKRILGWRVGDWDRTAANRLSHARRWARGTLEEWQERKRLKADEHKKHAVGWRRFQAYRKEE